MTAAPAPWLARPGLAGGIDKDGSRAAELLATGFGSVEFGTVTAEPLSGVNAGVAALAANLGAFPPGARGAAVGVGLGLPPDIPAAAIAGEWLRGLQAAWPVADYLSFNLSARASQRCLAGEFAATLAAAFGELATAAAERQAADGRPPYLALKLPLGPAVAPFPAAARAAIGAGFAQVTVVLPETQDRFARLADCVRAAGPGVAVVAVGGIRSAADVASARRAGASGVQVHRLFAELGSACLGQLMAGGHPGIGKREHDLGQANVTGQGGLPAIGRCRLKQPALAKLSSSNARDA